MHRLFATSSKGLFAFDLKGDVRSMGLQGNVVSQTSARDGSLLAAVPVLHEVHKMMSYSDKDSQPQKPGLYLCEMSGNSCKRVYDGNVKSCAIGKESTSGKQRWYAGIEPADVLISEDNGATWSDTGSFKAIPTRDTWYDHDAEYAHPDARTFPAEPHQPHTLSIDFAPKSAAGSQAAAEDVVMAGIEVGGCLVSASDGLWETRHGPIVSNTQRTQLCVDVHQVRPDPFDGNRWFATCGATPQVGGEGGCFVTEDQGSSWRRVFDGGPGQQQSTGFALGQGYAIGLALNPFKKGELIVTAGDRPPGIGVHIHHSIDGGKTFQDITEEVYGTEELKACKGGHTPVPYFVKEGALLGGDTGDILLSEDVKQGRWRNVCQVSGHITTITETNRSPSSVTH